MPPPFPRPSPEILRRIHQLEDAVRRPPDANTPTLLLGALRPVQELLPAGGQVLVHPARGIVIELASRDDYAHLPLSLIQAASQIYYLVITNVGDRVPRFLKNHDGVAEAAPAPAPVRKGVKTPKRKPAPSPVPALTKTAYDHLLGD